MTSGETAARVLLEGNSTTEALGLDVVDWRIGGNETRVSWPSGTSAVGQGNRTVSNASAIVGGDDAGVMPLRPIGGNMPGAADGVATTF